MTIGYNIRRIRELKKISQDYIAHKLGISERAYSKIENENSRLKVDALVKISEILEVGIDDIINYDDQRIYNNIFNNNSDNNKGNLIFNDSNSNETLNAILNLTGSITELSKKMGDIIGKFKT